jgi:hypothetical protein
MKNQAVKKNTNTLGVLEVAIARFIECNPDKERLEKELFDLLHYAMESNTVDTFSGVERSNLMSTYIEVSLLLHAIYKEQETASVFPSPEGKG